MYNILTHHSSRLTQYHNRVVNHAMAVVLILGLGGILALLWMLLNVGTAASLASGSRAVSTPASLARQHDPVVVGGDLLSDLAGDALDTIFVYAYQGGVPGQIPFQFDERNADGRYVSVEDGLLDANDELVFMAADGGDWVSDPILDVDGTVISPTYIITITDPLGADQAWAYIYKSDTLSQTFTSDYVSFDAATDRITSPGHYSFGFHSTYSARDYLTLGNIATDLLDQDKLRLSGKVSIFPFSATEEDTTKEFVAAIDGPVRVTRLSTNTISILGTQVRSTDVLFAYRSLSVQPGEFEISDNPKVTHIRISTDWNSNAVGMTYYDANNPDGTSIDGSNDAIVKSPPTNWTQIAGSDGSIIYVSMIPADLGGTQASYYKDDSAVDGDDTGDQRSYGDAGFEVDTPNTGTYPLLGHVYFFTGTVPNVGNTYLEYYNNPLQVSVASFVPPVIPNPTNMPPPPTGIPPTPTPTPNSTYAIYLPLILRNGD